MMLANSGMFIWVTYVLPGLMGGVCFTWFNRRSQACTYV